MKKFNLKTILTGLLSSVMALTVFAACDGEKANNNTSDPTQAPHTHTAGAAWNVDKDNHWHICECGEKLESAAHTLEDSVCSVCKAEVVTDDDGTISVSMWTEYGDITLYILYDAEGNITSEDRSEYTYDNDGNKLTEKNYYNGEIAYESEFAQDADGFAYETKRTDYYEDGTKEICEYDEHGNEIKATKYDAEGNIEKTIRREYTSDDEGNVQTENVYENDNLTESYKYKTVSYEGGWLTYTEEYTVYYEDGSKLVTVYNENAETVSETKYDADGNVIE